MKRIFFLGFLAGVTMLIVSFAWGMVSNMIWPELAEEYQNPGIFRPWTDPAMSIMLLHPIIVGVILSWLWSKTNHLIKVDSSWKRGVTFGFIYWIATISGMIISYSTFQISLVMVLNWTLNGAIQSMVAGLIFSYYDSLKETKTR